ncbi:Cytochrome c oxidase (cbb3-type) subunit CcoN (EC [Olavius sp. associated proteobacterium Delta 1]|nr:Cytochrome c oxidase (cbb3-type) subunit CcoN (EC [Olavius sp. associated proteobacterium Delta 1]
MGEPNLSTPEQNYQTSNPTAKAFTLTSAFWFAIATTFGLIGAGYLIAPDFLANIEYIHFGRIRPMHINAVLFGFVTPGLLAVAFYYFPKLLRTELFSHKLGVISAIFWNFMVAAGVISISMGYTQGREYAELPWAVDIMVVICFVMVVINILMTIRQRKERILFVSIWYVTAAVVLTSITYCLGNVIWKPDTGALQGIPDAILLWFYGHNIFGLLLSPMGLAVAYYVLPIATRSPLYSHTLSLLGFWSLIIVYTHIGTHHLLQVPVPTWLKTISIVDSVAMVIPVMIVLINLWYTVKGKLGDIHADIGAKFVFTGTIMYFFVNIQGSMMALPHVQRITHFNNWVVGHAHLGVLGFAGVTALGGLYFIMPRITGKPLYSRFLADVQYWFVLIGMTGFAVVLTTVGLIQGNAWYNGETLYRTLPEIQPYYILRAALGLLIVVGAYIGLYNVIRSLYFNRGAAT